MLFRFSLYGFLKNLRFFESFLLLALLARDYDFAAIGWLVATREATTTLLEVPSGSIADTYGRRRCMVASMAAYVGAALLLGLGERFGVLALAMVLHGVGDAFRSGTHKAMIDAWLRQQGRAGERTRIYGVTRSWSKTGSAVSALIGGILLASGVDYRGLFLASAGIAAANLVNLATYPRALDQIAGAAAPSVLTTLRQLGATLRSVARPGKLRRLLVSSTATLGSYEVARDYLQPVVQHVALALPITFGLADRGRTGLAVGIVSSIMFLLAGVASRRAHRVEALLGGADRSARLLVGMQLALYALLGVTLWAGSAWLAMAVLVGLALGQNLWRPIQVGRVGEASEETRTATVMSIESQASALCAAAFAPLIGYGIDRLVDGADPTPTAALVPLGLLALPMLVARWAERPVRTPAIP